MSIENLVDATLVPCAFFYSAFWPCPFFSRVACLVGLFLSLARCGRPQDHGISRAFTTLKITEVNLS